MASIDISILVVDDDPTCLSTVAGYLQKLNHHVVAMKNPLDALSALRTSKSFDLILTDVHMPEMSGLELLKHVEEEFKIPVVLMSGDSNKDIMLKGLQDGAAYYFMKPVSPDNLQRLWQFAMASINRDLTADMSPVVRDVPYNTFRSEQEMMHGDDNDTIINFAFIDTPQLNVEDHLGDTNVSNHNLKRPNEHTDEPKNNTSKKPKLTWTTSLHSQFLEAVNKIGVEKAVPKKILEYMNVPGLRRENIASHLQKYRIFMKRMSEASSSSPDGIPNNWNERPFRSSFVLNEITFLANNLQQQYKELLKHSQAKGKTKDANISLTSEIGQSSTQGNSSGDTNPNNNKTVKNVKRSKGRQQEFSTRISIQGNLHDGTSSNAGNRTFHSSTNNYVGLRISTNGELVGTTLIKDLPTGPHGGDKFAEGTNNSIERTDVVTEEVNVNSTSNNSSENAPPPDFGIDKVTLGGMDSANPYIPRFEQGSQQETLLGASSQEMLSTHGIADGLRQAGVDIHVDQELFGNDFDSGSFDMQANTPGTFGGLDQGIFLNDDISFDYYLAQVFGVQISGEFNQDGNITKPN